MLGSFRHNSAIQCLTLGLVFKLLLQIHLLLLTPSTTTDFIAVGICSIAFQSTLSIRCYLLLLSLQSRPLLFSIYIGNISRKVHFYKDMAFWPNSGRDSTGVLLAFTVIYESGVRYATEKLLKISRTTQ